VDRHAAGRRPSTARRRRLPRAGAEVISRSLLKHIVPRTSSFVRGLSMTCEAGKRL